MTPLEKVEIVKKVVTIFEEAKPTPGDKLNILMSTIEMLIQPGDGWHISLVPTEK